MAGQMETNADVHCTRSIAGGPQPMAMLLSSNTGILAANQILERVVCP